MNFKQKEFLLVQHNPPFIGILNSYLEKINLGSSELLCILKYFLCPLKDAYGSMGSVRMEWESQVLLAIEKASDENPSRKKLCLAKEASILLMVAHDGFSVSELCLHYLLASSNIDEVMLSSAISNLNGMSLIRVFVINKVMVKVYGRKMLFDERFNMSIWQLWDYKEAQIDTDTDLISQLKEHNHHLIYYMQLYLDKIPQNHDSTAKRVLFESSKPNSSRDPDTNTTIPIIVTTNIMKSFVAPDSIESQSNSQKSPPPSITKIQKKFDANSDLFEDFMDTYFRSPTQQQTTIRTQTEAVTQTQTSDTEPTDKVSDNNGDNTSCYTPESPSQQLPQNFAQSPNLSPLLNDCPSSHEETEKASEATFTSLDQNDMVSFLQTQNHESQPIFAYNPFNNSYDHANILNSKAAVGVENDLNDNVFSLIDSDEDPEHPLGAFNVINPPTKTVLEPKMPCVVSDDSDGDYILSDYESGDDDGGLVSDDKAVKYEQTFLDHPDTKADFIIDELRRIYGCKVNRFKVYRAKKMALQRAGADHESSYRLIRSYAQIILNKMPQALALVSVIRFLGEQSQTHFDRFILSFPSLRDGFKAGCRPFIRIDGCHLKGPYKGVMLSVVALDANIGIFPVAVCVCSVEITSTWTWFLGHLKTFLEDARQLTFMCDRQKGIQNALALEFPNAHVRFCVRHILANLKTKHPHTNFKAYFWAAARACNRRDFDVAMTNLKNIDEGVYETLRRLPLKLWARHAFDNSCKSDHCTNNMTESFNTWLGVQRKVPMLNMLEWMRKNLMKRLIGSPNPVARASEWLYEVDHNHMTYIVDLQQHQGSYLSTYTGMIHPIPDKSSWPITPGDEIYPPLVKRPPGSPKMNRRREADEVPPEKKRYRMQCLQDRLVDPLSSALGSGSTTVIHMQPYEHVRTTVEVHEPKEMQLPPRKTNSCRNQEGPSGTKKMNPQQMANIQVDAPWLGVQGRKIMAVGGISLRENQTTQKKSELNNTSKGKAPAFPPYTLIKKDFNCDSPLIKVVILVAGGASSDTSGNASGYASSWA
ncbi:SWIM-type domain-containing protein [Citrus sinensis]|nr:SWIM-type domain-containing protein [Citrus sinensis]